MRPMTWKRKRSLGSTNNNLPLYRFLKTFYFPLSVFRKSRSLTFAESSDSAAPVRLPPSFFFPKFFFPAVLRSAEFARHPHRNGKARMVGSRLQTVLNWWSYYFQPDLHTHPAHRPQKRQPQSGNLCWLIPHVTNRFRHHRLFVMMRPDYPEISAHSTFLQYQHHVSPPRPPSSNKWRTRL